MCLGRFPQTHLMLGILALECLVHEVFVVQGVYLVDAMAARVGGVDLLVDVDVLVLGFSRHGGDLRGAL